VLALTSDATEVIERILASPGVPSGAGIRIMPGSAGGNDATPAAELQVAVAEAPGAGDDVIEEQGARVFVEDTVSGYLEDKTLDAVVVDERVQFSLAGHAA
jgi:iron-sulfur cluster assembly protein